MTNARISKNAKTSATSTAPSLTPAASAEPPAPKVRRSALRWAAALVWSLAALGLVACATPGSPHRRPAFRLFSSESRDLERLLVAVEAAWPAAVAPNATPETQAPYNRAVSAVLEQIQDDRIGVPWNEPFVTDSHVLSFEPGAINSPLREIYNLTEAIPASTVRIRHAERRVATDGLGVACVTTRGRDTQEVRSSQFVPLNGRWLPATFVVDCSTPGKPVGRFYNSMYAQSTVINGRKQALATDFTAGLELSLGSGFLRKFALSGLLKPAANLQHTGLYFTETFNPKRIPVVMVHGLASDPHIWQNPMNEILADPVLRERFQLWYFLYPTGLPVPFTAKRLRQSIDEVNKTFDPEGDDPPLHDMVLIGHSMGGLLSRMQTIDSGQELWASYFAVPPEQLLIDPRRRRSLVESLFFEKSPHVDRAIFVATPHRGSEIADFSIVRWAVNFIRLPLDIAGLATEFAQLDLSFFNPALQKFDAFGTRSVDNLSPRHPLLHGLNQRPILVPHHSIIGNRGRPGPLEKSSDGVVPYTSSHLPTALSEKIVPAPHSCVNHPMTAAEIVRVLHEHLNTLSAPPARARR
jgi:pimeloyl-ACP methyl ester carboxylesterase